MTTLQIELPPKLIPVFAAPNMFIRGAYGGRGSAKTRSFAKMAAVKGLIFAEAGREGIILCVREYMNSLDDSSMAEIKAAIASEPWLTANYEVGEKYIRTRDGRINFKFAGLHSNLDSIKSKAMILLCWADEAEQINKVAWQKLIPTIREEDSELWVTWNPELDGSDTDERFRKASAKDMIIVQMNWRDNPWFPSTLERTRADDQYNRPDQYEHVWEGAYVTVHEGAYFSAQLSEAERAKRICRQTADPLMAIRSYHDIGGAGAKADAYSIWICQFIDREIRVLDHYTTRGQSLAYHVQWMRENGYEKAEVVLPHDGVNANNVSGKRYEDHWADAGFSVKVIPNQGTGAAKMRVEAAKRLFPRIWFDADKTEAGRKALGWYHEKIDEKRGIGLGPDHDWSSHDADSFGLMCVDYQEPGKIENLSDMYSRKRGSGQHGFMRS
jgi:phage terminase large subunit